MNRTDSQLLIVILILILIGGVAAHAQVPELINYQGRLVDGGALVNGNTQIVFRIYNQSSGGSPLWQETQTVAAVDGLFSAHIGASNDTAGTLSDVLTNASCFLEIKVGTTVMGPREQVLAVPYSLQADGVPPGAISSAMLADGAVTVDKIATGAVTGDKIGDVDNLAISGTLSARILEVAGGGGQVLQFAQATSDGGLVHVDSDDPGGFAYGVWGDGSFIYLANGDGGLHTYSVDGAGNLTHIDSDDQGDDAYGVWGDDSFIYLANGYGGLHTYSVDGSGYLTHIDSDDQGGCAYGIWGDGSFIYLADGSGGLHTYSVDGSGHLTHIDSDFQGGHAQGVWTDGSYICLANGDKGLSTYSVDGSGNLTYVASDDQGDYAYGVWGDGSFIYLANYSGGLHTYSLDGSGNLTHIDSHDQGGFAAGVWGGDSFIYLANGDDGLHTYALEISDIQIGDANADIHVQGGLSGDGSGLSGVVPADNSVTSAKIAGGAVTAEKLAGDPVIYGLTTITNPTPEVYDYFGRSVAGVGGDKFLVGVPDDDQGATNAGVAHLYRADGTFLMTVTNPTPAASDRFGFSIAGVGSDKFIVGAHLDDQGATDAGVVHLYQNDGTFLMTLTNPTPDVDDDFGVSVAGVGSDKFIVGAYRDDQGATDAGVAHLYHADGTFLMTLTNPIPAASEHFGYSVAGVGRDKFLIGAHGVAHLYQADGAFLMTITNPLAGGLFGYSVAGVGSDKFIVGARDASVGGYGSGAAYLYQSDGTFLMTLTNPTPAESDSFGCSVAGVGSDKFIVGASDDDQGAGDAGVVHLYRNDGAFLMTITNPTPAGNDWFGISVAGVGSDKFIVGAYADNQGATDAGVAHLYSLGIVMDGLIVRGENIENGTIVNADLAPNAVGTLNIQDDAVSTSHLEGGAVTAEKLAGDPVIYGLTTITNPTPEVYDYFGRSVAGVGGDKFLVGVPEDDQGATNAGVAHLYRADGTFLLTVTNPTPAASDRFGISIAGVGSDKFIVGANLDDQGAADAGAAHLYQADGTFLMTLTNPTPAADDYFGFSTAGVGSDKFIVGAHGDDQGAADAGVVHLYRSDGTFLMTLTNPTPAASDRFGYSVAGVGRDKFLVGAHGVAHLYQADGAFLMTITNPTPLAGSAFGYSVAGVGSDKFVVGALDASLGGYGYGAAYLYQSDGTFLMTLTNPTPAESDGFGGSVAGVGSDKFIVGASNDDQGAGGAGVAHLYRNDGVFLMTITNPTPASSDWFGISVAGVGGDKFIVGAYADNQGATDAGVAHLYSLGTVMDGLIVRGENIENGTIVNADLAPNAVGTLNIQDDAVTSAKIADGAIVDADVSGSANIQPSKIAGTAATLSGNQEFDSGTLFIDAVNNRIGIGTNSPEAQLHIVGGWSWTSPDIRIETPGYEHTRIIQAPNGLLLRNYHASNSATAYSFRNANDEKLLTVNANSRIGVATDAPKNDLQVWGDAMFGKGFTPDATANSSNIINILSGTGSNGWANGMTFYESTSGFGMSLGYDGTGAGDENSLRIYDSDRNALVTFKNGGRVGIGTTTPAGKLDVNGAIYQRGGVLHADYVFEPEYALESIEDHAAFMWEHKHLGAMPPREVDEDGREVVEVGSHRRGLVEELEKAHIYIEQLKRENEEIREQFTHEKQELNQRLEALELRLEREGL